MEKTVLVLGQARSGTSMTAALLDILGVNLSYVDNPSSQNPKGAFEDITFNTLTSKMHLDLKKGIKPKPFKNKWNEEILAIIEKRNKSNVWGWKSALTHFSIDFWIPYLRNPHIVVVTRNPYHTALSWKVHKKEIYKSEVTLEEAMRVICGSLVTLMDKLNKHKNIPTIHTTYEDIKAKPDVELMKIGKFIGFNPGEKAKEKALEFIMPNYSTIKGKK